MLVVKCWAGDLISRNYAELRLHYTGQILEQKLELEIAIEPWDILGTREQGT